jgi:hypothetical protein
LPPEAEEASETRIDRGDEKACCDLLRNGDENLTDRSGRAENLAGHGHQHNIGSLAMVSVRADDTAGRFLIPV